MNLVIHLVVNTLAVLTGTYLLQGVHVDSVKTAVVVAIVIAILNTLVKPVLIILTLPITVITLGLFLLAINAAMILLAAKMVPGFRVDGFWWALAFSVILSIVSSFLNSLV
jgi:putative membrane protein